MTMTFKETDDGLSMTTPTGLAYTAKFDGKDYAYKGDPGTTSVSLKRIDANTVAETGKRDGKVVGIERITVAADGKTMSLSFEEKLNGHTTDLTLEKQYQADSAGAWASRGLGDGSAKLFSKLRTTQRGGTGSRSVEEQSCATCLARQQARILESEDEDIEETNRRCVSGLGCSGNLGR
jgi:hypothetical protein